MTICKLVISGCAALLGGAQVPWIRARWGMVKRLQGGWP